MKKLLPCFLLYITMVFSCEKNEPRECDYTYEQENFDEAESAYFSDPTTENHEKLRAASRNFLEVLNECGKVLNGPEYWSEHLDSYVSDQYGKGIYYVPSYVTFWIRRDMNCGDINVTLNGQRKTIDWYNYHAQGINTSNGCNSSTTTNFETHAGTYTYTANCDGRNWNGTVTLRPNDCRQVELTGSPNNGGTQNGRVSFWVVRDFGCGGITVTVNGQSAMITRYWSTVPNCDMEGTATFSLPPGTYNFTAKCNTLSWAGTVTVSANGCLRMELTA